MLAFTVLFFGEHTRNKIFFNERGVPNELVSIIVKQFMRGTHWKAIHGNVQTQKYFLDYKFFLTERYTVDV